MDLKNQTAKRELKFRAFDKRKKRMVWTDWNSFRNWYDRESWGKVVDCRGGVIELELSPPMQYTGLKDKNGNMIFEGDIVKMGNPPVWFAPRVIEFKEGSWMGGDIRIYIDQDKHDYNPTDPISQNYWEIIGNIYETPELLNQ